MKALNPLEMPLSGTVLIEASAGTGKTYAITSIFLRLLIERGSRVDQIVVVTFTKAATAELRARVRSRVGDAIEAFRSGDGGGDDLLGQLVEASTDRAAALERLVQAQESMDQALIFTIHGWCQRILIEHAFESRTRFDAELIADDRPFIFELVQDFWAAHIATLPELQVRYLEQAKVGVGQLASLAHNILGWPEMELLPVAGRASLETALNGYLLARRRAQESFRAGGREATHRLEKDPVLKGQRHSPEAIARYGVELEHLFATESRSLFRYPSDAVERLSSSALKSATRVRRPPPEHEFFVACELLHQAHESLAIELQRWLLEFKYSFVEYVRREAKARKDERGVQSFDDLLYQLRDALEAGGGAALGRAISQRYPVALIDEFQDTDPVQYQVFKSIYSGRGGLFLIGDPKQAIYGFRGADVFAYLAAAKDAAQRRYTLSTSYRADPALVGAQNALFSRPDRPFVLDDIRYQEVRAAPGASNELHDPRGLGSGFKVLFVESGEKGRLNAGAVELMLYPAIAADIARLLHSDATIEGEAIEPRHIAVLTRRNDQARFVQDALRSYGIPSVLHGDSSVFDVAEAAELGMVMRAMAEPSATSALRTGLLTPLLGVSPHELLALEDDEALWERHVERFRQFQRRWVRSGFSHAMHELTRTYDVNRRTLLRADGERRMTNLRHLVELLHNVESSQHLGPAGLASWFANARLNIEARVGMAPDSQQIRLESDDLAVQLTTMHKSKGLEYPIVYCPFLWRSADLFSDEKQHTRYHDTSSEGRVVFDMRPPADKPEVIAAAQRESLAESMRLLYVALTRAKQQSIVVWGGFNRGGASALGYLFHQSAEDLGAFADTLEARFKQLDDAGIKRELQKIAELAGGAVEVVPLSSDPGPPYRPRRGVAATVGARQARGPFDAGLSSTSFSSMIRNAWSLGEFATIGRDVDESSATGDKELAESPASPSPVSLALFPRGAKTGNFLHSLLEHIDFCDESSHPDSVRSELLRAGFDGEAFADTLTTALSEVLATPLGSQLPPLNQISMKARRSEMEFTLPIAGRTAAHCAPSAASLAALFSRYPESSGTGYGQALNELGFSVSSGYLRGFIDLVFETGGRYYVVDYKSNYLGDDAEDYRPEVLEVAMRHHHYHLQAHLYALAVHRYLRTRIANYSYEVHFGGAYYLFLRGMSPAHPPGTGVFHARPNAELMEELSQLFDGAGNPS